MTEQIKLTNYEQKIVLNAELLYAKNNIIKKVYQLFAEVSEAYMEEASHKLSPLVVNVAPKISRGEQYLGLPYVMLDYPRNFARGNTFAIRTLFWWGHFFSIHLQLSGEYQQKHVNSIKYAIERGEFNGWFVGVHENEWHHHFEQNNYVPISKGLIDIDLAQSSFIKLAKKIPLQEWENVREFLTENFRKLISLVGA
jgi:hypothetical protein